MPRPSHPSELWRAGAGKCGICGEACPEPPLNTPPKRHPAEVNVEHVFPRNPAARDLERIRRLSNIAADPKARRKVCAHRDCNTAKGNRAPTACEVLFLMAVNLRLHTSRGAATRARRRERELSAAIQAMQAEVDAF